MIGLPAYIRRMNLRDLQYIVSVAELGHFGRAAAACHVSQPTLSGQILKLEEELGVAVFERVGKRVRPTPVGEQIIAHARKAIGAALDISATARASRDPLAGIIRLGVIPTIAPYFLPDRLANFSMKFPGVRVSIVEEITPVLLERLQEAAIDMALLALPVPGEQFVCEELLREPLYLVVPRGHRLASRSRVDLKQIEGEAFLLLKEGHCFRENTLSACGRARRRARRRWPRCRLSPPRAGARARR